MNFSIEHGGDNVSLNHHAKYLEQKSFSLSRHTDRRTGKHTQPIALLKLLNLSVFLHGRQRHWNNGVAGRAPNENRGAVGGKGVGCPFPENL